ncbi:CARDB domain-containing protein [Catalinimonas sp. 4WD22]|uniref:CARDB domain-containing protein n=1 Tax=Catalinimonas locisalis TaxID=3133978 RepID=UPI003100FDAE
MNSQSFSFSRGRRLRWLGIILMCLGINPVSLAQEYSNLIVSGVTLNKTRINQGESIDLSFNVVNVGGAPAHGSNVGIYTSTDAEYSRYSDNQLNTQWLGQMEVGTKEVFDQLEVSQSLAPGRYYLFVVADYDAQIDETNERDNISDPIVLVVEETEEEVFDMALSNVYLDKPVVQANENVTINFDVNFSSENTDSKGVGVSYHLNYTVPGYSRNIYLTGNYSYITPGKTSRSRTLSIPYVEEDAEDFSISIRFYDITDQNESNNSISVPIQVNYTPSPQADLIVSSQNITSSTILKQGEQLSYNYTIKNEGDGGAGYSYTRIYLSSNGSLDQAIDLGTYYTGSLGSGADFISNRSYSIPNELNPGTYYLLVKADDYGYVTEKDEENNLSVGETPIRITKAELSDLTLGKASISKDQVSGGENILINAEIFNIGSGNIMNNTRLYAYLATPDEYEKRKNMQYYQYQDYAYNSFAALNSGDKESINNWSFTIPEDISSGKYYLLLQVDGNRSITESNEDNNFKAFPITINNRKLPNLTIIAASLSQDAVQPGEQLTFEAEVHNIGEGPMTDATLMTYFISDDEALDNSDFEMNDGGFTRLLSVDDQTTTTITMTIPASYAVGSKYIIFKADGIEGEDETNEDDNLAIVPVVFTRSKIDLAVDSENTSFKDEVPNNGYHTEIDTEITNLGESRSSSSKVKFYLSPDKNRSNDDYYLGEEYVEDIDAGDSEYVSADVYIPGLGSRIGTYYLFAQADADEEVIETNESNNIAFVGEIEVVPAYADLTITNVAVSRSPVAAGELYIPASFTIVNEGYSYANTNVSLYISSDNKFDESDIELEEDWQSISAENSVNMNFSFNMPANTANGTYYILLVADPNNDIEEVDEENNVTSTTISVVDADVDLNVSALSSEYITLIPGQYSDYEYTISNSGTTAATGTLYTRFFLSDDDVYSGEDTYIGDNYMNTSVLEAGEDYANSNTFYVPIATSIGAKYLLAVTDFYGYIAETDEANNTTALALTISNPDVDLIVSSLSPSATKLGQSSPLTVTVTVENQGTTIAEEGHTTALYLSADNVYDIGDTYLGEESVFGMDPAPDSYTFDVQASIPGSTTAGMWYLIAVADINEETTETDELNNETAVAIEVLEVIDMDASDKTVCSAIYRDPGGEFNYYNNHNIEQTFLPATSDHMLQVTFTEFNIENGYDDLYIYDGNDSSAPLIGAYTNTNSPGTVTATNVDGTLTFVFTTDGSVVRSGWEAEFSCVAAPAPVTRNTTVDPKLLEAGQQDAILLTEEEMMTIRLYPNPTLDEAVLEVDDIWQGASVSVFDPNGRKIQGGVLTTEEIKIDLSARSSGLYVVKLQLGERQKVLRLLKK